jgi:uncharacterized repeat protein (TIGR02543 family)/prepilin-type N-terminal cleavage/methylation domain-containing protein
MYNLGKRKTERGLTLLELLVTIAVIAIVAAISVPIISNVVGSSRVNAAFAMEDQVNAFIDKYEKTGVVTYNYDTQTFEGFVDLDGNGTYDTSPNSVERIESLVVGSEFTVDDLEPVDVNVTSNVLPAGSSATVFSAGSSADGSAFAPETTAPETTAPETTAPAPQTFTVSYNYNSGASSQTVEYTEGGSPIILPEPAARANYTFDGWFTDNSSFENSVSSPYTPSATISLHAKWTARVVLTSVSPGWSIDANGVTIRCAAPANGASAAFTIDGSTVIITKRTRNQIKADPNLLAATSCTSGITTMFELFRGSGLYTFNKDISHWDTSDVTSMTGMFSGVEKFNQDISNWDTSKVTSMKDTFVRAYDFNQNISGWDTSNVIDMTGMFWSATSFNQDLSGWNVSKIRSKPLSFDGNSPRSSWVNNASLQPVWGTTGG